MLRYFVQVIQNLLATGILSALLFASCGSGRGRAPALWGCLAGTVAALVLATLRRTTALINRGWFNTWTLAVAIVAGILFIVLGLCKPLAAGRNRPGDSPAFGPAESREAGSKTRRLDAVRSVLLAALFFYALPSIFLYPTEFVLAGESVFSADFFFKCLGYLAGLTLVACVFAALHKTGSALLRVLPAVLPLFLAAALAVNMVSQLATIVQFLLARRVIPMARWLFRIIVPMVNNTIVFMYVVMGIAFLPPLVLFLKSYTSRPDWKNPAERRKIKSGLRSNRRWCCAVAALFCLSVFSLTVVKSYNERGVELSPAEPMTISGAEILIPIERVEDGHLHRFNYTAAENIEMRFIVIKKNAVAYGVGLDACDICGPTGYYERKGEVICRLCDVVMNISTIGFKGGCNPVPLAYTLRSGNMVVNIADLEAERNRFK
ncbi:MAG: Fe-S-containing protein [Treponema sp.]|nr:Fe-S-containing protein [Treponema sp.]